jgi:putative phosphoribosyl transferase
VIAGPAAGSSEAVRAHIPLRPFWLDGVLSLPSPEARGLVLLAHPSGMTRAGDQSRAVAAALEQRGIGVGFLDLLTGAEQRTGDRPALPRFGADLLAGRLAVATDWVRTEPRTRQLPLGYFGVGAGAAGALVAAAERSGEVRAVVCLDGRAELVGAALPSVRASTLLIVGGGQRAMLDSNRRALALLGATEKHLEVAGPAQAAGLVARWFEAHLAPPG